MNNTFSEVKLFQVKPAKTQEFEELIKKISAEQKLQEGCLGIKYLKRSHIFDEISLPPREISRIIKCVKYYAYWEFDTLENYGNATKWFFDCYAKDVMKLLIMPFDINCGYSIE